MSPPSQSCHRIPLEARFLCASGSGSSHSSRQGIRGGATPVERPLELLPLRDTGCAGGGGRIHPAVTTCQRRLFELTRSRCRHVGSPRAARSSAFGDPSTGSTSRSVSYTNAFATRSCGIVEGSVILSIGFQPAIVKTDLCQRSEMS